MDPYQAVLARKERYAPAEGFATEVNEPWMFPFQNHAVQWALAGGRRALFEDTGLGKSRQQLAFADRVQRHTGGRVLILAPLAVGPQTVAEAESVGLEGVAFSRSPDTTTARIVVTNYDNLDKFDAVEVAGVVLDESSILKSFMGSTKLALCERFAATPFRLACTATPAPNDILEIGNHSEFLGILSSHQMIARWFINDTTEMGKYRLKGHAVGPFWDWVASWALCAGKPSDIGPFDDTRYNLPPLNLHKHVVETDIVSGAAEGSLFRMGGLSATKIHGEKRLTTTARAAKVAELIAAEPDEPWLVWCETNYEAEAVMAAVPHAVEVSGSMSSDVKAERLLGFCKGGVLLTKPKIAGLGMNWQHCARVVFAGGSYSFEAFYQAVRRCWRFGQTRPVDAHVILAFTEQALWEVVSGKADAHDSMKLAMFAASRRAQSRHSAMRDYHPTHVGRLPSWLVSTHPEPKDI